MDQGSAVTHKLVQTYLGTMGVFGANQQTPQALNLSPVTKGAELDERVASLPTATLLP